jgi:signal transduction histidine kinase
MAASRTPGRGFGTPKHGVKRRRLAPKARTRHGHFCAILGPNMQCISVDRTWLRFRGRTLAQERGLGWTEGIHPDDLETCLATLSIAFAARQPFHSEFRARRADGSYAQVAASGVPQYFFGGRFIGYILSLEEVTQDDSKSNGGVKAARSVRQALFEIAAGLEHRQSGARSRKGSRPRELLLPSEILFEALDRSVTPMLILDEQGHVAYCNIAFLTFATGKLRALKGGVALRDAQKTVQPGNDATGFGGRREIARAWLASSWPYTADTIRIFAQPLGKHNAFSFVETEREKTNLLHEQAFLHDVTNAVGGIQMIAELLDASNLSKETVEYVHLLRITTDRLLSEIDKEKMLLDGPQLVLAICDASDVLDELLRGRRHEALARNRRIEIVKDCEPVRLLTDKTLLLRVLDNLLRNAEEATGPEELVTIGYRRVGLEVEFWVHNPTSMPESVCSEIFKRSVSTKGEGHGLGMRGIKFLSEKYLKGTVAFSSTAENGTTFSLRCPAAPKDRAHRKPIAAAVSSRASG